MRCRYCARLLLCCATLTLQAGCGPDALTYPRTLRAMLSPAVPAAPFAPTLHPPGQLQLDIAPDNLEELDFVALSGCAVQATVLKYNSSLGRAAKPSQRLLLALEYLDRAPACIARLRRRNSDALADRLAEAWHGRREQLPALIFNATLGGDEYTAFWLPSPAPGQYPRVDRGITAVALAAINNQVRRWLGGNYRTRNRELELLLSEVAGGDGGALMAPHCQQLSPPIAALEAQLITVLPPRYRSWMKERDEQPTKLSAKLSCPKPGN
jgi:Protein of unknown function (DUF3080)